MNRGGLGGGRGGLSKTGRGRGALLGFTSASSESLSSEGAGRGQTLGPRNSFLPNQDSADLNRSKDNNDSQVQTRGGCSDDSEILDNYQPMKEAYNDPKFNSYEAGPGGSLLPSQHVEVRRNNEPFKLHVANIPSDMSQKAVENIFLLYGDVVSVFVHRGTGPKNWGFIEYNRLQEAQSAILALDRKEPHNLSVKFAKEKVPQQTNTEDINTPFYKVDKSSRGRKTLPLYGTDPRKLHPKSNYNNRNTTDSNGYHNGQFSDYNPSVQVELNKKVMDQTTSTAMNGRVVRGRAYNPTPDIPKSKDPSVFQNVEKFKKPVHSEEVNPPEVTCPFKQGQCLKCNALSATVCHVCKAWYCSYTCIENDWGNHKSVCRPKTVTFRPDGTVECHEVPDDNRESRTKMPSPTFDKSRRSQSRYPTSDTPPRRPFPTDQRSQGRSERRSVEFDVTEDNQPKKQNSVHAAKDEKSPPPSVQTEIDYTQHPPEPRDDGYVRTENGSMVAERNAKYEANIHKRDLDDQSSRKSSGSAQPTKSPVPAKPAQTIEASAVPASKKPSPEPPIPRGIFSDCLVLYTTNEDEGFSVTPVALAASQDEMMATLTEYFQQPRAAAKVTDGSICGAQFVDGCWYRVKVCSIDVKRNIAKIVFIDFGNEDESSVDGLKALPDKLVALPPMAFRILFVGGKKPFEINDAIKISPIKSTACGSWLVRTPEDPEPEEEVEEQDVATNLQAEEIAQEIPVNEESTPEPKPFSFPLPRDRFQMVTIMHVEQPGLYWVVTLEGVQGLLDLNEKLRESAVSKVKITPEKNQLYNHFFANIWCRALLTNLDPCTVFYIDYGNSEEVDPNGLLPLPLKLKSIPPMAIRIKLAEGTSSKNLTLQEMSTLNVKAYGKLSSAILALAEGDSYVQSVLDHEMAKAVEPVKPKKPIHVLSMLTPTSDASITITKAMGEDHFCGSLQIVNCTEPLYQSLHSISQTLKTKKADPNYKPVVNDDVIVKINKDSRLYRGYVMFVEGKTSNVALIDIGCVEEPSKLAALPAEFKNIPPSGVRVSLHKPTSSSLSELFGSEFNLKNIKITDEGVTAEFGDHGQATILPWVPLLEEARIPAFKLENKCEAIITAFHSPQAVYVRPCTPECIEVFSCVLQDVCTFCITAEPLKKVPLLGELVAARWNIDNNFYRALVSKKEGNSFKVIFLDFGNIESAELDDLRSLPDNFKKLPATVVKIGLKDVPGPMFNVNATKLMNDAMEKESKFIVSHEGDLRNVVLKEAATGEFVNDTLAQAMEPSWVKNPSKTNILPPYLDVDIRYDVWEEGTKLEGAVVGVSSYREILFVNRSSLFEYIHSVMTPQMSKYCEEIQERAYNPRAKELVLAKFEGDWYRAVTSSEHRLMNDPIAKVFFIDYGNFGEMAIEDLRKMAPEFVSIPAAVKHCKIYGLPRPDTLSEDIKKKIMEALESVEGIELIVVKEFDLGRSVVWIPSLESTLTALSVPFTRPVGFS